MIFGHNTTWYLGFVAVVLPLIAASFGSQLGTTSTSVLVFLTAAVSALIAYLNKTATTPISSPVLPAGTTVTVTDDKGNKITDHTLP